MLASHFLRCYFGKENAFLADRVGTISAVMSCASKLWITAFPTQTESSNHIISLFGAEVAIFHVFVLSLHYNGGKMGKWELAHIWKISGRRQQLFKNLGSQIIFGFSW